MAEASNDVRVDLEKPIEREGEKISALHLRRPGLSELHGLSLRDLMNLDATAIGRLIPRIATPNIIDSEVAELDSYDLFAIAVEISAFFLPRGFIPARATT